MLIQKINYTKLKANYRKTIQYFLNGELVETHKSVVTAGLVINPESIERVAPIAAWYRLAKHELTPEMESQMLKAEGYISH